MSPSEEETESKVGDMVESVEWDVDMEIQLFYAMANNKPVGINKHFHMTSIWEKLSNSITKEITTQDIWKHLDKLYDIQMLDDTEPVPFPNDDVTFTLPETEFGELMKQKCKDVVQADDSEDGRSPSPKVSPQKSLLRATASKESTPKGARKDSTSSVAGMKSRKESVSSHASTDTPSIKSEKDYDRRRDSRDSNASGSRDTSTSRKATSHAKSRMSAAATWDSPSEDENTRRGRRRANTSTPPATTPAKRRRT